MTPDDVRQLYEDLKDAHRANASSNDLVQIVDDWFVEHGFRTIIFS